jgi:DNA-binding CsgD family transcriptional regulator
LKGLSYKEVALHLNISINTVEKHMEKATKVLNVEYLVKLTIIGIITKGLS